MSKMRKTSLSHTFTLSITLFTACVIVFSAWFFYRQERAVLMAELQRHGVALAENLAFNCEYDLLFTDVESLSKLVDGVVQDQDVIYALIINTDGALVVEKDFAHYARVEQTIHERFPQFLELIAPKHPPVQTPNVHFFENPDGTYDIFAPVFFIQNAETRRELLGIVVVGISVERVTGQLRNIQKQVVEVAVFMLVLAIIVA